MNTVYKFRTLSNQFHRDVLFKLQLYESSPFPLNDPFDIDILEDFWSIKNLDDMLYLLKYNKVWFDNGYSGCEDHFKIMLEYYFKSHEKFAEGLNKTYEYFSSESKRQIPSNEANLFFSSLLNFNQLAFYLIKRSYQNSHLGIISLARNIENPLLWGYYADKGRGFAIGFDIDKLRTNQQFICSDIVYEDEVQKINPVAVIRNRNLLASSFSETFYTQEFLLENIQKEVFTKRKIWKDENEFRLLNIYMDEKEPTRIFEFDRSHIAEVVLGAFQYPDEENQKQINEILIFCKEQNIPIYRMKPDTSNSSLMKSTYF